MKKYFVKLFLALICTLTCITLFSCAGGGSAGNSDAEGLSLNITTSKGRAASRVQYEFTVQIRSTSYSSQQTKIGNPVSFYFPDTPLEETLNINVTVKLGSVHMFSGTKSTSISEPDTLITIDLSNQLEETIQIPYSEIDNIDTIIKKSTADSPTIIITDSCSDIAPILAEIQTGYQLTGKKTNLNLMNTGKTSYSSEDITNISNATSYLGDVLISEESSITPTSSAIPENISCSGIIIKLPDSSSYATLLRNIKNSKNLSNVIIDFNNKIETINCLASGSRSSYTGYPTNVTGIRLTGVKSIGDAAFYGWTGLINANVTIPASVTYIESHAFTINGGKPNLSYEITSGWQKNDNGTWKSCNPPPTSYHDLEYYGHRRQ